MPEPKTTVTICGEPPQVSNGYIGWMLRRTPDGTLLLQEQVRLESGRIQTITVTVHDPLLLAEYLIAHARGKRSA